MNERLPSPVSRPVEVQMSVSLITVVSHTRMTFPALKNIHEDGAFLLGDILAKISLALYFDRIARII